LDKEIEKMASWNVQEASLHPDWLLSNTFQSTGEMFGLIDPVSIAALTPMGENELDALVEQDAEWLIYVYVYQRVNTPSVIDGVKEMLEMQFLTCVLNCCKGIKLSLYLVLD
jgi:hypothetical protein